MSLTDLVFGLFAAGAIGGAAGVAFSRNILRSAFSLLFCLLGVAGLYGVLRADVAAVAQVLVYIGGVLVLILFAIMLTRRLDVHPDATNPHTGLVPATLLGMAALGLLWWALSQLPSRELSLDQALTFAPAVGRALLGEWLLPFEAVSLVLLSALLGAVAVARKEMKE